MAQTWKVAETGWGRIEDTYSAVNIRSEYAIGEMNIPRWRKTAGTIKVDYDKREAVIRWTARKTRPSS